MSALRPRAIKAAGFFRVIEPALWCGLYVLLVAFPVLLLLAKPLPRGGGFLWDFAMAVGFSGLAMMCLQFALTARFRRAAAPFGIDIIYYFHRWAAIAALSLILLHYAILRAQFGDSLPPANPWRAPLHMTAGRIALLLFVALVATSLWRKPLRLEYDRWRIVHAIGAALAVGLGIWHIEGVGHYTAAAGKRGLWLTYAFSWLAILGYIRFFKPWLVSRRPYRVLQVKPERGNSWTVIVEPAGSHRIRFAPGQFAWLTLGASPFRQKEHPFSFSGSAYWSPRLEFTIKELGDFTRTIRNFKAGDSAYVDGPYGVFTPDRHPHAESFVLIAGGVGIAPMMSMLRTFADRGERRPILLIYGNRDWEGVIFREELEDLAPRLNLRIEHVLHNPPSGWTGETGMITRDVLQRLVRETSATQLFFVCGPPGMTKAVSKALAEMRVPLRRIHSEHFDMV